LSHNINIIENSSETTEVRSLSARLDVRCSVGTELVQDYSTCRCLLHSLSAVNQDYLLFEFRPARALLEGALDFLDKDDLLQSIVRTVAMYEFKSGSILRLSNNMYISKNASAITEFRSLCLHDLMSVVVSLQNQ
jgi:hypothetical protein